MDLIGPIAKWLVAGLLVGGGAYFLYRKLVSGAIAKDDLKEVAEAEKERQDADEGITDEYGRLHGAWTRVRDRLRRQRDDQQVPPSA